MVDKIKCDHCGAESIRPVVKEFDGKSMNFCCRGCLQVYELMREQGLPDQPPAGQENGQEIIHRRL